jgi:predicted SAM-dependent methyltransferase
VSPRQLHIGGRVRAEGWEIMDANAGPAVDHVGDAGDLGRFAAGTFSTVYASHVLEHFDYKDALAATIAEWHRVLTPGGTLYVSVPDLAILASLFVLRDKFTIDERYQIMRMIFGGHVDRYDYHQVGLDPEFLATFLQEAGFVDLRRVPTFGLFDDTSSMLWNGYPISLNVVAKKAG